MIKGLAGALAILLAAHQVAAGPAAPVQAEPVPDVACVWGICRTEQEMILGGIIIASSAMATALTVSPYGPEQAGEVAAGLLLSSVVTAAASIAVVSATVYYYGPRLWQHLVDRDPPEKAAWQQYLDGWQQEIDWQQQVDDLRQEIGGWPNPRQEIGGWQQQFSDLRQKISGWEQQFGDLRQEIGGWQQQLGDLRQKLDGWQALIGLGADDAATEPQP